MTTVKCPVCKEICPDREGLKSHLLVEHQCDDLRVLDAAEEDIIFMEEGQGIPTSSCKKKKITAY